MQFDVVIVGAGPAGLACACQLAQLYQQQDRSDISICVVEKGAEVGAHIISGAVFETTALDELFPDWQQMDAPVTLPVYNDRLLYLTTQYNQMAIPKALQPKPMQHGEQSYVISLGNLCRWLAKQAEALGVSIFPGFAAADILYAPNGAVSGVITSDMGIDKTGEQKANFQPGIELKGKFTVFAEGARGHLGKELLENFSLSSQQKTQHYALGMKEIWQRTDNLSSHQPGEVLHTTGWPLSESATGGGGFLYQMEDNQIAVGLIVDLNYRNPYLSPFEEFQRFKHHPAIASILSGAERISYGARAITKGGITALPKQQFPGGLLIGCDAGTLNVAKIKGCHSAMKSGMLAADALCNALEAGESHTVPDYQSLFEASWLYQELDQSRNFAPALHRYGPLLGGALASFELNLWQPLLQRPLPWTIRDKRPDHECLMPIADCQPIDYPKPDGVLSFDKPSSVYLSGTQHEENQPCHLLLANERIPIESHLPRYGEPAQLYCPAGVYEVVSVDGKDQFQINPTNCVHCKTCDIKDPSQNITWRPPEGGGGPGYQNM